MNKLIIAENALVPETWLHIECEDILHEIKKCFNEFPDSARIYFNEVAENCDVTPKSEEDIEKLSKLEGLFYVIVFPKEPVTLLYLAVAVVAAIAVTVIFAPNIPNIALKNTQQASPNNELSQRTNKPRINARIPDIYGTVRSTPDLIQVPLRVFDNHQEVEVSLMAIGRGEYQISDICDDDTQIANIAGTSVAVYGPGNNPSAGVPFIQIGTPINFPAMKIIRSNSVNGQVLRAPNSNYFVGQNDVRFEFPNLITAKPASSFDFTSFFAAGDNLGITNGNYGGSVTPQNENNWTARFHSNGVIDFNGIDPTTIFAVLDAITITKSNLQYKIVNFTKNFDVNGTYVIQSITNNSITLSNPSQVNNGWDLIAMFYNNSTTGYQTVGFTKYILVGGVDFSGSYTVLSVSSDTITLNNPSATNINWNMANLGSMPNARTEYFSPRLITLQVLWVGPFIVELNGMNEGIANFLMQNGGYKDDGSNQYKSSVNVEIEITPIDFNNNPLAAASLFNIAIEGSATTKTTRAATLRFPSILSNRASVRARRVTPLDTGFKGTVIDETRWKDLYATAKLQGVDTPNFGNITLVHSITYATTGALSIKERKLNMLVTRKLPQRISGSNFSNTLFATNNAADILSFICLDPKIGNRNINEVDFDNIYNTIADINLYFGTSLSSEFCYTFDSDNLSFEETLISIANSIFCTAYRRGSILKIKFEKQTNDSVLIFNHRNKIPDSEIRTITFGNLNDNDGIEYEYVNPVDDSITTIYLPQNQSAINPKKIESLGIRNSKQAYFQACRLYNKILNQNTVTNFESTREADLLIITDRILVADNTRSKTQDGEVLYQNGLVLTLSQSVNFQDGISYVIFLQMYDGTTDSISINKTSKTKEVVLNRAPLLPLVTDRENFAVTTYIIVGSNEPRAMAFLVSERSVASKSSCNVKAVNYSDKYYLNDKDFINGVIT